MIARRGSDAVGAWRLMGADEVWLERAHELAGPFAARGETVGRFVVLRGETVYLKGSPLRGKAHLRHLLRSRLLRLPLPRLAEFENLEWLRANGFEAPRPLAAGALFGHFGPRWQYLLTERVEGAPTLREALDAEPSRAQPLFEGLLTEVARLHAKGFVHRDLYPRNVLVRETEAGPRFVLLDAWRGGTRPQARGAAYDLGCLFLHAPSWLGPAETRASLDRYVKTRADLGEVIDLARLRDAVDGERRAQRQRIERKPALARGLPLPPESW